MKLSILICSLEERCKQLINLLTDLYKQVTPEVEVLTNIDNRQKTTGAKRNELLLRAKGDYIAFVDDDDKVAENYISRILEAVRTNPDCVGMEGFITFTSKGITKKFIHSIQYNTWFEKDGIYYRCPNHLSPVRRELALKAMFPDITVGEDRQYSERLRSLLKTEVYLETPIYFYLTK